MPADGPWPTPALSMAMSAQDSEAGKAKTVLHIG
jgi:hypothetical protein